MAAKPVPGTDGNVYVPYEERTGNESIVYFTRDLSAAGFRKAYEQVNGKIHGKVGLKLHTGEQHGPNILPRPWVEELRDSEPELADSAIVETNTFYEGDRYTTEQHRETIRVNGWDFCPVDIMDEEGTADLPVAGGKWFDHMTVGSHMLDYDSLVVLTHFKGHMMGGFGGSNKNIGIGKKMIHQAEGSDNMWSIAQEELMERISESAKATVDFFSSEGRAITFVNVMRNMSVSCDCEGIHAQPVVTPNVGILASEDMLAIDQASVDIVFAMKEEEHYDLVERITSRHGLRQLSYMKELGIGNDRYVLIDLDNGGKRMTVEDAVQNLKPFEG